jgi:hypothetical protein
MLSLIDDLFTVGALIFIGVVGTFSLVVWLCLVLRHGPKSVTGSGRI